MPASTGLQELLEAGVHFGHQTRRWNPNMRRYIFGELDGIHIIDLLQTEGLLENARRFAGELASGGGTVLFVGTKKQARDSVQDWAERCQMPYVNKRWLGGLLTNFTTIQRSIARLRDLEAMATDGRYEQMPKKEIAKAEKEKKKLVKNLEGIRHMGKLPDALFVIDTRKEQIAVDEARKLKIPVIGIVDTNCDPDQVDFIVPGNDDALRAIRLFTARVADAVLEGRGVRESATAETPDGDDGGEDRGGRRTTAPVARQRTARPETTPATTPASV